MNRCVLKICAVVALSIALTYSGAAWAIDSCLREHGHSDHATLEHHHEQDHHQEQKHRHDHATSENHKDSQDPSVPIIHCTSMPYQIGPAAAVASFTLLRLGKVVPLDVSLLPEAISPEAKKNLWLNSLFRRILTFSIPFDRTRHLFLSVLQI
jgi:hypothetical protein